MMPQFFGIVPGGEFSAPGIRITVPAHGDKVWMHGKWLELAPHHGVAVIMRQAMFVRPDGRILSLGQFPAWIVRGTGKHPALAAMFDVSQFIGGRVSIGGTEYPVAAFTGHSS